MSIFSDHVIPGNHGKVFTTDAKKEEDLLRIKNRILSLEGVKDVLVNAAVFPAELTVHTVSLVTVEDVEKKAQLTGFHVIPKKMFEL